MQIGELARRTGVSPRALRHYEDRGLLVPARTNSGYRDYVDADVLRVEQIQAMIAAGLGTAAIGRYLDCARSGEHGTMLELCPDLRAELAAIADRLAAKQDEIGWTQQKLRALVSGPPRDAMRVKG